MKILSPEKALIFRITHHGNLPWMLEHGLHCRTGAVQDPAYVDIGDPHLITKRIDLAVPIRPFGTLGDYVPFYFTPRSPMLLNIKTGARGIRKRSNDDIIILVSSLYRLRDLSLKFLFTDRHAYVTTATFYEDIAQLNVVDWNILRRSDFKRDNEDLGKLERYMAEVLVHRQVPLDALLAIACCNEAVASLVRGRIEEVGINLRVVTRPGWYF